MRYIIVLLFVCKICIDLTAQVPDSTFGVPLSFEGTTYFPGITACDFEGRKDRAFSLLQLDDGKIMLAGYTRGSEGNDFALVRLLPNGQYDETAGPQGQVRLDLGFQNDSCLVASKYQSGQILMGGCVTLSGQSRYVNLLIRIDSDGNLDMSFGNNGQVIVDLDATHEMITKILPQSDGKIIIAGNACYGPSFDFSDSTSVFVGRLFPDGQTDSTFGVNGFIYSRYNQNCKVSLLGDILTDNNNRIVFTGASYDWHTGSFQGVDACDNNIEVCRYLPDGQDDISFGDNGKVEIPFSEGRANALNIDESGKILIAGIVTHQLESDPYYTFIARLLPNGVPDSTFGIDGLVNKYIAGGFSASEPLGILRLNNRIILGYIDEPSGDHLIFGLIGFTNEGILDTTFGAFGVLSLNTWYFWTLYNIHSYSQIDSSSLFIAGYYRVFGHDNMMVIKIKLNDGTISTTEPDVQEFKIFPNPIFGDLLYLDLSSVKPANNFHLSIWNICGILDLSEDININEQPQVDVSRLTNGIYFVELVAENTRFLSKLIIQRKP